MSVDVPSSTQGFIENMLTIDYNMTRSICSFHSASEGIFFRSSCLSLNGGIVKTYQPCQPYMSICSQSRNVISYFLILRVNCRNFLATFLRFCASLCLYLLFTCVINFPIICIYIIRFFTCMSVEEILLYPLQHLLHFRARPLVGDTGRTLNDLDVMFVTSKKNTVNILINMMLTAKLDNMFAFNEALQVFNFKEFDSKYYKIWIHA